jgi:hypothetical protein
MTTRKARVSRPVNGLVRPPSSYEEYLLLSEKDKLRLMKQEQAKKPNAQISGGTPSAESDCSAKEV